MFIMLEKYVVLVKNGFKCTIAPIKALDKAAFGSTAFKKA